MSLDGFLTFLGLMVAAYAALPDLEKLRLRINAVDQVALGAAAFTATLCLQFYSEIQQVAPAFLDRLFDVIAFENDASDALTNQDAAFLVVVAWATAAILLHLRARPAARKMVSVRSIVARLHDERRYLEITQLVGPYLPII